MKQVTIHSDYNPYRDKGEGRVNQLAPVVALLSRAAERLGARFRLPAQEEVFDRLYANAPRVAIISGSPDHIGHIMDEQTVYRAALAIWRKGGVPYTFGIPVMCDTVGQANIAMSYSLFTRNLCAEMIANQMEAHNYHAAIVLQGCDKTPLGSACGLAALDMARRKRGEAPVWATFIPIHVLAGAALEPGTAERLNDLAERAKQAGAGEAAEDLRGAMACVVQCAMVSACSSVFQRLTALGVMSQDENDDLVRALSSAACESTGGMCAFHGTGNSSRIATAALGLAHPAGAFLSEPPSQQRVDQIVGDLFSTFNRPEYSVLPMVRANWANTVRVHSATGGSSNLSLHLVALANYAGRRTTIEDMDAVRCATPIPDIFNYSLSEYRSHYELARQCETGRIRGIDTILYELRRHKVPLDLDAPTCTGATWKERLKDKQGLPASGVKENPIVLSKPRRAISGVDMLKGNFFDSAVVKISGMADSQLEEFDDKLFFVHYLENEDEANSELIAPDIIDKMYRQAKLGNETLLAMLKYNDPELARDRNIASLPARKLFDRMVEAGAAKVAVVISAQGPRAFGMPEMYTPMNHINCNRRLRRIATVISDGRYSGVSYGAAIGHLTPEAADGGEILYLKHGDILRLRLKARRIDLIDGEALAAGKVRMLKGKLASARKALGARRMKKLERRRRKVATLCMQEVTDASMGAIPMRLLRK